MHHIDPGSWCSFTLWLAGIAMGYRQLGEWQDLHKQGSSRGEPAGHSWRLNSGWSGLALGAWKMLRNFSQDLRAPNKSWFQRPQSWKGRSQGIRMGKAGLGED